MKQKITLFLLLLFSLHTYGQDNGSSKYVFSVGYGYYDIYRAMEESYIKNSESYSQNYIYNLQTSLNGPIYAKFEKNLSKRMGLGISIAYDQFTVSTNADTYYESTTNNGNGSHTSGSYPTNFPHDGTINGDSVKTITEKYSYKSLAINLRWNVYFINKEKYQLYAGLGLVTE
jgi:hypothetical protein